MPGSYMPDTSIASIRPAARTLSVLAAAVVLGACSACNKSAGGAAGTTIPIGEYASLTGTTATFGTSTHNGMKMAIDEANDAGGIKGKKIKLFKEDDQSKPDVAHTVVTKLINENNVVAVLGEVASTRSLAGAPVCQQNHVPMISPSSTNPKVTQVGDYIFRVCFTDDFQAAVDAHFANDMKWKRVAIFKDIKNDYSVGFAKVFTDEFTKLGGQIPGVETYQEGDPDFRAQLNNIKGMNPDAVLIPGYYGDVGTIARQAREIGLKVPLLGGDGWDSPQLVPGAGGPGQALEGCYFSDHYFSTELKDPNVQKFITAFKAKNGTAPDALAALGYDAAGLLIDAMK
ncbi:MAG TPA: ABC transporter substrate-binding protein, partial [Chthonomonadales bacterium]|nr:ABC transporter substrate-binding protein [Chthonomonadales bacterium]